jgi:hypothetical protein
LQGNLQRKYGILLRIIAIAKNAAITLLISKYMHFQLFSDVAFSRRSAPEGKEQESLVFQGCTILDEDSKDSWKVFDERSIVHRTRQELAMSVRDSRVDSVLQGLRMIDAIIHGRGLSDQIRPHFIALLLDKRNGDRTYKSFNHSLDSDTHIPKSVEQFCQKKRSDMLIRLHTVVIGAGTASKPFMGCRHRVKEALRSRMPNVQSSAA